MTDGRARLFSPVQAKRLHHLLIALTLLGTLGVLVHDYSDEPRLGIEGRLGLDVPASALQRDFRIHFASFADCSSAARFDIISRQARHSGLFDAVHVFQLHSLDPAFLARNRGFVPGPGEPSVGADGKPLVRGCGYWLWKPQSVLQALRLADPGDVVVYADAGCSLVHGNWRRFWTYVEMLAPLERRRERQWTKGDLLAHFNVTGNETLLASPQLHSTFFYLVKSPETEALVAEWVCLGEARGHHFIDDSPSAEPNAEDFMENRHDQSIFSLLRKTRGAVILKDDSLNPGAPIQASRCRYGREPSCWYTPPKQALWVWAAQHVSGLARMYGSGLPAALPRRGGKGRGRVRAAVLPLAEDA